LRASRTRPSPGPGRDGPGTRTRTPWRRPRPTGHSSARRRVRSRSRRTRPAASRSRRCSARNTQVARTRGQVRDAHVSAPARPAHHGVLDHLHVRAGRSMTCTFDAMDPGAPLRSPPQLPHPAAPTARICPDSDAREARAAVALLPALGPLGTRALLSPGLGPGFRFSFRLRSGRGAVLAGRQRGVRRVRPTWRRNAATSARSDSTNARNSTITRPAPRSHQPARRSQRLAGDHNGLLGDHRLQGRHMGCDLGVRRFGTRAPAKIATYSHGTQPRGGLRAAKPTNCRREPPMPPLPASPTAPVGKHGQRPGPRAEDRLRSSGRLTALLVWLVNGPIARRSRS